MGDVVLLSPAPGQGSGGGKRERERERDSAGPFLDINKKGPATNGLIR